MAKFFTLLLAAVTILSNTSFSQKLDHERTSPWFFGVNVGGTWHHTDVKNKTHYGWGLVLGRTFNRNYANLFSYDLKFRYLGGAWRGQNTDTTGFHDYENTTLSQVPTDYKNTYGYSINNFQTKAHEFNLELSIHLNRFTERTGLDPYIFGGVGATLFQTKGNLTDDMGFMYDYSLLSDYNKSSLSGFMDKTYESDLDGSRMFNNLELMGHLGIGLGYYFTRNVALGFEHKTTFTGGDRFDGVFNSHGKFKKDIYHYTSLYLKIYFNRARVNHDPLPDPKPPVTSNPTSPVECPKPVINLRTANNSTVNQPSFQVNGIIKNASQQNIVSTHNAIQTGDFVYNNREEFKSTYHLQPGLNTITLNVENTCGTAQETIYVNYVPACETPVVQFTNPRSANSTTTVQSFSVQAQVTHLDDGFVQLHVNGQQSSNFNYNPATGMITSNIILQNGVNTIQIIVSNRCGTNSQTVYIDYNKICPTPIISVKGPTTNYGTSGRIELSADIQNISSTNQVDVYVNGQKQSAGTYHSGTSVYSKTLNLSQGQNTILIRATNSCGTNEQTIFYEYGIPCIEPTVTLTNPSGPRVSSTNSTYVVQATIRNVTNPQTIVFKVNNKIVTNFNYSFQSGLFTSNIQLGNGSNSIELSVSNECGYATAASTVSYTAPCNKPVLTWKQPASNIIVTSEDFTLEAIVQGINSANDVIVSLNGVTQTAGSYSGNTAIYSKQLKLQKGNNFIQLTASNYCGEVTTTVNIHCKGSIVVEEPPVIVFTNSCNARVSAGLIKFTGNVFGVKETHQIQIKLQDVVQNGVTFKQIANGFSFELQIRAGYSQTHTLEVTASNSGGTSSQSCRITTEDPPVIDNDIIICHTVNGVKQTLTIKESQWIQYQRAGAVLGKCPEVIDNDIIICYAQRGQQMTLTIKESQWSHYEKLGATKGKCPETIDNDIVICVPDGRAKKTMTIKESQWQTYQQQGATLGECPEIIDNDIIICLPQGGSKVTMTVKESQWPRYQQAGATLGECPIEDPDIVICQLIGDGLVTKTIKKSQWDEYHQQGASLGACPEISNGMITICVPHEGQFHTLTIKQSQWPVFAAQGATVGACQTNEENKESDSSTNNSESPSRGVLICVKENSKYVTKTISPSEWSKYESMGAIRGACTEDNGGITTPVIQPQPSRVDGQTKPNTTTQPETRPSRPSTAPRGGR